MAIWLVPKAETSDVLKPATATVDKLAIAVVV